MARTVYTTQLLFASIAPGSSAVVELDPTVLWVVRDIVLYVSNGYPDTGGGDAVVMYDETPLARCTFPGLIVRTWHWELRSAISGGGTITASCTGGASLGCDVEVTAYRLTLP